MPSDKEKSQSLLDALEARMRQAETFAWAVPALALTAQALLLSVVFNHSTTALGRVLASLTGLIIVLAALHLLLKHTFNFDMYEAVIDASEKSEACRVSREESSWSTRRPFRKRAASENVIGLLSSPMRIGLATHASGSFPT